MSALKYFFIIVRYFPAVFALNVICLLALGFIETLSVLSFAPIIDLYQSTSVASYSRITNQFFHYFGLIGIQPDMKIFVIFFLSMIVLKSVCNILFRYITLVTKYKMLQLLMVGSFESFFSSSISFFNSVKQGVLLSLFSNQISAVGDSLPTMSVFFSNLLRLFFYAFVPLFISWKLTLFTGVAFAVVLLPTFLIDRLSYFMAQKNLDTVNNMQVILQESISAVKIVLGFGNTHRMVKEYKNAFEAHRKISIPFQMVASIINGLFEPVLLLVLFAVLYMALYVFTLPLSEVLVMMFALKSMIPMALAVMAEKNSISGFIPSYEYVQSLQNKADQLRLPDGKEQFVSLKESIHFHNVHFTYDQNRKILNGINLEIKKGQMIAFVGSSGAGKTTITDLLMGLYKPTQGRITVDGKNLDEFAIDSFRLRMGFAPQDPILFNATIKQNILWANKNATDAEVMEACRLANADGFIQNLAQKYDTMLGDRGTTLSGGERQRIAFARTLVRRPELLILDEATSSLDAVSEVAIQKAIEAAAEQTTVIVIAHRLSTVRKADRIYVIDQGRVVESGTYDSLSKDSQVFKGLLQSQLG